MARFGLTIDRSFNSGFKKEFEMYSANLLLGYSLDHFEYLTLLTFEFQGNEVTFVYLSMLFVEEYHI